jgi:hypothetical protein
MLISKRKGNYANPTWWHKRKPSPMASKRKVAETMPDFTLLAMMNKVKNSPRRNELVKAIRQMLRQIKNGDDLTLTNG